jgi:hypothetical protein
MTEQMPASSRIRSVGGVPTLMAGKAPLPAPIFCLLHDQAMHSDVVATLYRNGIGVFATRNELGVGNCRQTDATIELAVKRLANVACAAPGAWLMADCDFFPSEHWLIKHPHEGFITADRRILVLGQDGTSERRDYLRVPGPSIKDVRGRTLHGEDARIIYGRRRVSPFSELFARGTCGTMQKFFAAMKAKGLTEHLAGVFVGCYIYGEWNLYMIAPDHGRTAVRSFRRYLERKYGGDRALQTAWGDPVVTLKDALPPREYAHMDVAPLKLRSQRHLDYQIAEARALAQQFSIMTGGIRRLAPHLVVGGFFPGANPPQSDWLRLARNPAVDFLATPLAYENRGPGHGVSSQSPFCDGFAALGKVWFDEIDTRTMVADKAIHARYGRATTIAESVGLLWRDAGQMLIRGHHGWWLDFGHNGKAPYSWHLKPAFLEFHRRFAELWHGLGQLDRRPWGEIKVFIPSESARDFQILYHADCQRHAEWMLLGAPVESDVLENLLTGRSQPGKLNVIYGAACLSRGQLRRLAARLRGSKSLVVWMGGAGLFEPGRPFDEHRTEGVIPLKQCFSILRAPLDQYGPEGMIPLKQYSSTLTAPLEAEGQPTPEAVKWLGLPRELRLGQYYRLFTSGFEHTSVKLNVPMKRVAVNWILEITDPAAVPLVRLTTNDAVVAAMKKDATGTTHMAYNLPILNTVLFRALAQKAGCHLFARTDDVVYASQGLVLLHAAYSGIHQLYFPRRAALWDLTLNRHVPLKGRRLTLELRRGETRLYSWGTARRSAAVGK